MIPYGRQIIDEDDIQAVCEVLRSNFLTTGPQIQRFESAVAEFTSAQHGIAVSSGTAALHCTMNAIGIKPGDEVIVPTMTFAATANSVIYQGGTPVFADVCKNTLLIDPDNVEKLITNKTKAIVAVDYAGLPCDYDKLHQISSAHNLTLIADACHSLGATYNGIQTGSCADLTVFSFHPVKHITTGEGGMVVTNNADFAKRIRTFRNHGMKTDASQRENLGVWFYEIEEIGFNYRMTDIQAALGVSQLKKLPEWIIKRTELATTYNNAFHRFSGIEPVNEQRMIAGHPIPGRSHAYHLYVVQLHPVNGLRRNEIFIQLRQKGIGVNVHYTPVHFHPFYRKHFGCGPGQCPIAESAYENILSLPLWPGLKDEEVEYIITTLKDIIRGH